MQPIDIWGVLEHAAARHGGRTAITTTAAPLDYRALHDSTALLSAALGQRGIEPGDRVALLEENTPAFLSWTFACAGVGAILVPLNLHLTAPELAAILSDARPRLVVARAGQRALVEDASRALDEPPECVWLGSAHEGAPPGTPLGLKLTEVERGDFEAAPVDPDDVAQLYYTSGTTGRPKGVPLTHRNVVSHALAATTELDLAEDDVWGHIAPMFHLADAWATVAVTAVGGAHAFVPAFDAQVALHVIDELGVTVTNLVPTMLRRMLAAAEPSRRQSGGPAFRGDSLRLVLSGGAPIAPETVASVLEVFRCEYVQTYGLTETSPYLTLAILEPRHREQSAARQLARRARTGRPFETVELDVVDDDGKPVPRDDRAVGEIVARGSTVMRGYWHRPEETGRAFRGDWFLTGDLATIDRDGWVNIVDRKKDMILTGGENVYSIEVENALYAHAAVAECAVYGAPSDEWGEEVRAAVVLRGGVAASDALSDELREHCRGRLARYKVPRRITFRDALPRTGSGKIAKRELRDADSAP